MDVEKYFDWFEHFDEGVYFVSPKREIVYFNEASEAISGFKREEVVGSFCYDNILNHVSEDGARLCFEGCPLMHSIETRKVNHAEVYLHHKKGHRIKISVKTLPVIEKGEVVGALEIFTPLEKGNLFRQSLEYYKKQAMTDALTGLNNRAVLDSHVPELMASSKDMHYGVLFMDIDDFKAFNDTYGHAMGDRALEVASNTLSQAVKTSDIVIRYGGEEFLVLAYDTDETALTKLGEKLRRMIEASTVDHDKEPLSFTISLGATMIRADESLKDAISRADKAMYESKTSGKNKVTTH